MLEPSAMALPSIFGERGTTRSFIALLTPFLAFALQWALWALVQPLVWFFFYPAVFISSWIGGLRTGLIATVVSVVLVLSFFVPAQDSITTSPVLFFSTVVFSAMGILFGALHDRLRKADQRSRAMVARALDCIVGMDSKGRVTEWNPAAEQTFGYTRSEAMGEEMAALIIPEPLRAQHRAGLEKHLRTGKGTIFGERIEMPAVTKDGREITVELTVTKFLVGSLPTFTGFLRDVSALKRAANERHHREAAQNLLDRATVALTSSLDLSETIQNAASHAVPGLADSCIIDLADDSGQLEQVAAAHVDPEKRDVPLRVDPRLRQGARYVFVTGRAEVHPALGGAGWHSDPQGTEYGELLRTLGVVSYMRIPIRSRGRMLGVLSLLRAPPERRYDASDLVVAEELARRIGLAVDNARLFRDAQDAIRVRDEFMQIASHELKTPLTPLLIQLDSLTRTFDRSGSENERVMAKLDVATRQVSRLGRLVESLLDVSRISAGRIELSPDVCDLSVLAREVAERFQSEAKRLGSEVTVSAEEAVVGRWDALRVEQILGNLLSNAIKYGSGKPIEIEVRKSDGTARVAITDRGIGMGKEVIGRLFGRFERGVSLRHYGGLGLGLFIARQFAEAHGGSIVAQSQSGAGSTFTLVLPLAQPAQNDAALARIGGTPA